MVNDNNKRTVRAGAVIVGTMILLLMASPAAHAVRRDDGDDPGAGLSVFETLGYFVAAPVALFAVIAALVTLSGRPARKKGA